ncbi:MAG: VOC family protein [Bacteroidota bacterium]
MRLHEIELGSADPEKSKEFYKTVLGLNLSVDQQGLKVFKTGAGSLDFNVSTHLSAGTVAISFLTDDLSLTIQKLQALGIRYDGPERSHLEMDAIRLKDPDGFTVIINAPTAGSPAWLKPYAKNL